MEKEDKSYGAFFQREWDRRFARAKNAGLQDQAKFLINEINSLMREIENLENAKAIPDDGQDNYPTMHEFIEYQRSQTDYSHNNRLPPLPLPSYLGALSIINGLLDPIAKGRTNQGNRAFSKPLKTMRDLSFQMERAIPSASPDASPGEREILKMKQKQAVRLSTWMKNIADAVEAFGLHEEGKELPEDTKRAIGIAAQ